MKSESLLSREELKKQMDRVNRAVIKMINQKKYPLCPQKITKIKKSKEKYQLTRLATTPNSSPSYLTSPSYLPKTTTRFEEATRTIGEHIQKENLRHFNSPYRASEDIQVFNNQISHIIWERKQEILEKVSSTNRQKENQLISHSFLKEKKLKKGSVSLLPKTLRNLRLQMSREFSNDSEFTEKEIYRRSEGSDFFDKKQTNRMPFFDFLQSQPQMVDLMKKYPVTRDQYQRQDFNTQLQKQLVREIKQNLNQDAFYKMRMTKNHKKIVKLG